MWWGAPTNAHHGAINTANFKTFQECQLNSRSFPVFPGAISNSRKFPEVPGFVQPCNPQYHNNKLMQKNQCSKIKSIIACCGTTVFKQTQQLCYSPIIPTVVWPTMSCFADWSKRCPVTFITIECWTRHGRRFDIAMLNYVVTMHHCKLA